LAKAILFEGIEVTFGRVRLRSSPGDMSPAEYEMAAWNLNPAPVIRGKFNRRFVLTTFPASSSSRA
jgi:hypothetical protein